METSREKLIALTNARHEEDFETFQKICSDLTNEDLEYLLKFGSATVEFAKGKMELNKRYEETLKQFNK